MNINELISKIEEEKNKMVEEEKNSEGLLRLQRTLENYQGEYKLVWSDEILETLKQQPEATKYNTKIKNLDNLVGGFRPQQLITLAAHTKHGKSQFGLYLLEQMEELSPVLIPLEQSGEEVIWQRYENNYSVPRFLAPQRLAAQVTVDWIEHRVVEGIAKYNTRLVMVDNLDYIDDGEFRNENVPYRIGKIVKGLKSIAKRWNVVIILQAHINQSDESNPPILRDLKNSSDIAQNSDLVMMLWRRNYTVNKEKTYTNNAMLSIQANRRTGKNDNIKFTFDEETGRFNEDDSWEMSLEKEADKEFNKMIDD